MFPYNHLQKKFTGIKEVLGFYSGILNIPLYSDQILICNKPTMITDQFYNCRITYFFYRLKNSMSINFKLFFYVCFFTLCQGFYFGKNYLKIN